MPALGDECAAQRDVGGVLAAELSAAGFDHAEEVGRGGFGVVFRRTQAALDRVAAVKVLTVDLDENRPRFVREQQAMGRLTGHPNIVAVLEAAKPKTASRHCRTSASLTSQADSRRRQAFSSERTHSPRPT